MADARWLLLIHQVPPKPDYLRVKVGRRLQRVGAVAVKNSVYVLPDSSQAREDFQWLRREIEESGGGASICRAAFVDGLDDRAVEQLFRDARDADWTQIAAEARALIDPGRGGEASVAAAVPTLDRSATRSPRELESALARLRARAAALETIDFFGAPERRTADAALAAIERELRPAAAVTAAGEPLDPAAFHGRVWTTRRGVFVDRMASAWLIRRFIDPAARFRFVAEEGYRPEPGELRFDMFDAEFTHEGDRCTFETLIARFALADAALAWLGEIVHDIDLRDAKFGHPESAGIERVLRAIATASADDATSIDRAAQLLDSLYATANRDTAS